MLPQLFQGRRSSCWTTEETLRTDQFGPAVSGMARVDPRANWK
jgi:hypothetical protein